MMGSRFAAAITLVFAALTLLSCGGGPSAGPGGGPSAFERIQTEAYLNATTSPATDAFTKNVVTGHLLIAVVTVFSGSASAPTDTLGTSFEQAGSTFNDGENHYLFFGKAPSSGADTVSVAFNGTRCYLSVAEYSGQATSGVVLDATIIPTRGASGTSLSSALYTANTGELLITLFTNSSVSQTYSNFGGGLTLESAVPGGLAAWGDNLSSAVGVNTGTASMSSSDAWAAKTWAFLPADQPTPAALSFIRGTEDATKDVSPPISPATTLFPGGNSPGNTILCSSSQFFQTVDATLSVTDSQGDTYTRIAQSALNNNGNNVWGTVYAAQNIAGGDAPNIVASAFSHIADSYESYCVEIQGGFTVDTQAGSTIGTGQTLSYSISAADSREFLYTVFSAIGASGVTSVSGTDLTNYFFSNAYTEHVVAIQPGVSAGTNMLSITVGTGGAGVGSLTVALIPGGIKAKMLGETSGFGRTLAEALLIKGHAEEALKLEEQAVKINPDDQQMQARRKHFQEAAQHASAQVSSTKP